MPKVSVVLPTFERWPLLSRALSSVLEQTEADLEVLVIDDCSSDETPARLAAVTDPRLRVLARIPTRRRPGPQPRASRRRAGNGSRSRRRRLLGADPPRRTPPRDRRRRRVLGLRCRVLGRAGRGAPGDDAGAARHPGGRSARAQRGRAAVRRRPFASTCCARSAASTTRAQRDRRLGPLGAASAAAPRPPLRGRRSSPTGSTSAAMHHQHRARDQRRARVPGRQAPASDARPQRFGARTAARKAAGDDRLAGRRVRAAGAYLRMGFSERSTIDLLRGVALLGGEPIRLPAEVRRARAEVAAPDWLTDAIGQPVDRGRRRGPAGCPARCDATP